MNRETFKTIPFWRKIGYIWVNYRWDIFLAGLLIFMVGSWIWIDYIAPQPLLRIEMIDGSPTPSDQEAFQSFLDESGHSSEGRIVAVSKKMQLGEEPDDMKCSPFPMLFCLMQSSRNDVYFWDSPEIEISLIRGALVDLREIIPEKVLEKYEDHLLYARSRKLGVYPCGIKLENNSWMQEYGYYESCTVGIDRFTQNPELAGKLLSYLLEQNAA